jgi:hypothetical protein
MDMSPKNIAVVLSNSETFCVLSQKVLLGMGLYPYFVTYANIAEDNTVLYGVHDRIEPACYLVDAESMDMEEFYLPLKEFCAVDGKVSIHGNRSYRRAVKMAFVPLPRVIVYSNSHVAKDLFPFAASIVSGRVDTGTISAAIEKAYRKGEFSKVSRVKKETKRVSNFLCYSMPYYKN